jgi:hypothetical protein
VWSGAYGALGYYLDVALDEEFQVMVYDDIEIEGDTSIMVEDLHVATTYYYRVKSYNTALTSDYSNTQPVTTLAVGVEDLNTDEVEIYTADDMLFINTRQYFNNPGDVWIYNITGQLLTRQQIQPGLNKIGPLATDQVIIVKIIIDGKTYQKKLLVH